MPMNRLLPLTLLSYGQVKVTARRLTVTPKNIDGQTISDNGRPCTVVLDFTP
jgi:hypothetical protein